MLHTTAAGENLTEKEKVATSQKSKFLSIFDKNEFGKMIQYSHSSLSKELRHAEKC